ncbi:MAG: diaminopimelate epimerase [Gammaproteobacteria bacterium]|nr:diaminopimelate epimerase [Gammaproteobacteria bacterium]
MLYEFTKMQGLGNDFVVIDTITQMLKLDTAQIHTLADRHFGIGFDQLLLVESSSREDIDFRYRIFNADGSEVGQCGNGARCFARFVRDKGLTDKNVIKVETLNGILDLYIEADGQVRVNMGVPTFTPANIPFQAPQQAERYDLELDGKTVEIGTVSMGNPHAVMQVDDINTTDIEHLGRQIESHPRFPERANAGFMQILSREQINLRVYERGAGETLACGSGACAAVVAGHQWNLLDETVIVNLPGGALSIHWEGDGEPVWMSGPAVTVFEGHIDL